MQTFLKDVFLFERTIDMKLKHTHILVALIIALTISPKVMATDQADLEGNPYDWSDKAIAKTIWRCVTPHVDFEDIISLAGTHKASREAVINYHGGQLVKETMLVKVFQKLGLSLSEENVRELAGFTKSIESICDAANVFKQVRNSHDNEGIVELFRQILRIRDSYKDGNSASDSVSNIKAFGMIHQIVHRLCNSDTSNVERAKLVSRTIEFAPHIDQFVLRYNPESDLFYHKKPSLHVDYWFRERKSQ